MQVFFTNHVASFMHLYWPALFPEDYKNLPYNKDWIDAWKNEIPFTMFEVERQLSYLMKFVETNNDYVLCILSSMGQEAVQVQSPSKSQLIIINFNKFMKTLGFENETFIQKPSMVPIYVVKIKEGLENKFIQNIKKLNINNTLIKFVDIGSNFFVFI
jgi:hypothetical protein